MRTLRQVWQMILSDKLFSGIYIFGTALALATGTVLAALFWAKIEPSYPEYERVRTCYIQSGMLKGEGGTKVSGLSNAFVRDFTEGLEGVEAVAAVYPQWGDSYVPSPDGGPDKAVSVIGVDLGFFQVFSFKFLAGKPFSKEEFGSGAPVAVISDRAAREVFGAGTPEDYIGRILTVDYREHRVCGVVRSAPETMTASYADVYVPYTSIEDYDDEWQPMLGDMSLIIVADDQGDVRRQLDNFVARFNASRGENGDKLYMYQQPINHFQYAFSHSQNEDFTAWSIISTTLGTLLLLLIVPALNLSGIISGRMEGRLAEMGVRKSFGATRGQLLRQVLTENLVLTLIGGVIGLAFAAMLLGSGNFSVSDVWSTQSRVESGSLLSPAVFATLLVLCALLNIMSALVPSIRSLRRPIVESLKDN